MSALLSLALDVLATAPAQKLHRCRTGWHDRAQHAAGGVAPVITQRTALRLVRQGLAEFDHPLCPTALTLTAQGRAACAQQELAA